MTKRTIAGDYDTIGAIDTACDPLVEYDIWKEFTKRHPEEWSGEEFTVADFEAYIEGLKHRAGWSGNGRSKVCDKVRASRPIITLLVRILFEANSQ